MNDEDADRAAERAYEVWREAADLGPETRVVAEVEPTFARQDERAA